MTTYEIFLLLTGLAGSLTVISIISAVLNEGSARATAMLILVTGVLYFLTKRSSDGTVDFQDISPAINKLLSFFVGQ